MGNGLTVAISMGGIEGKDSCGTPTNIKHPSPTNDQALTPTVVRSLSLASSPTHQASSGQNVAGRALRVFTRSRGFIQNEHTGRTTNFPRENNIYHKAADASSSWESGFNLPGT